MALLPSFDLCPHLHQNSHIHQKGGTTFQKGHIVGTWCCYTKGGGVLSLIAARVHGLNLGQPCQVQWAPKVTQFKEPWDNGGGGSNINPLPPQTTLNFFGFSRLRFQPNPNMISVEFILFLFFSDFLGFNIFQIFHPSGPYFMQNLDVGFHPNFSSCLVGEKGFSDWAKN